MDSTKLGFSGPVVSRLGLGTASIGRPGYINEGHSVDLDGKTDKASMQTNAFAVFDAARHLGVTYFDAARSYGDAEKFLAAWLQRLTHSGSERADFSVGSKWGYRYVADWKVDAVEHEIKDHSLPMFERQYSETKRILGSHLDLYQIHSVTPESPVLSSPETLRRLVELKEGGILIGLTTSGPFQADVIREALTILDGAEPLFDVVQSTWNVLEPSAGPALQEACDAGVGVIIKEALANGRLTSRGDFARQLSGSEYPADAVALASVLSQPFVSVVLSGATTVNQLESNAKAFVAESAVGITPIEPEQYWAERSSRNWN